MKNPLVESYIPLVEFLGKALGPNYEVALYDLKQNPGQVVAIENGGLSGRKKGAPPTDLALKLIAGKEHETKNYVLSAKGIAKNGDVLRSSTMFLRDGKELVGLLSISFNVSIYEKLSKDILNLVNMGVEVNDFADYQFPAEGYSPRVETYSESVAEVTKNILAEAEQEFQVPVDRLSYEEKMQIIALLNERGVFMLKGAVNEVAKQMKSSAASVYRYLSKVNDSAETNGAQ